MAEKILWLDSETTGLEPTIHSIIKVAGIIEIDGEVKEEFDLSVKPWEEGEITEDSVIVHGISIDEMMGYPEPGRVHATLCEMFSKYIDKFKKEDKFAIAGMRINFDLDMLSHFFMRVGDPYLGSWIDFRKRIDLFPIVKVMQSLGFIKAESVSLEAVCKEFDIEIKAHDAMSDITATRECLNFIKDNLSWGV